MLALLPGTVLRFFDLPYCPGSSSIIPYCSGSSRGGGCCGGGAEVIPPCAHGLPLPPDRRREARQGRSRWRSKHTILLRFYQDPLFIVPSLDTTKHVPYSDFRGFCPYYRYPSSSEDATPCVFVSLWQHGAMNKELFAKRLEELRKAKRFSQEEFGKLVGLSHFPVIDCEAGRKVPDVIMASRMADLLGVTLDYLLGNTEGTDNTKKPILYFEELPDGFLVPLRHHLHHCALDEVLAENPDLEVWFRTQKLSD